METMGKSASPYLSVLEMQTAQIEPASCSCLERAWASPRQERRAQPRARQGPAEQGVKYKTTAERWHRQPWVANWEGWTKVCGVKRGSAGQRINRS